MKKGCFIQAVIVVTIFVAAAIYIIQYKLDDWFSNPTKKFLLSQVVHDWDNEVKYIDASVQKDSLKALLIYLDVVEKISLNSPIKRPLIYTN